MCAGWGAVVEELVLAWRGFCDEAWNVARDVLGDMLGERVGRRVGFLQIKPVLRIELAGGVCLNLTLIFSLIWRHRRV